MKRLFAFILMLMIGTPCFAQEQSAVKDTAGMPKLEIPEITIVGKKAITLPFARKGEIYDVNIFDAPPPDTSLLNERPAMPLPVGALPRYEEPLVPLHVSGEASLGSFTTGNARGFVDYNEKLWGVYGNAGFNTTQGHTDHASGSSVDAEVHGHSLIPTDNTVLNMFRVTGGMRVEHDSYGLFGFVDTTVDRTNNDVSMNIGFGTVNRESNALDLNFSADIRSLTDQRLGVDSGASAVSPSVEASYKTNVDSVQVLTHFSYIGSSLDYNSAAQSPRLINLSVGGRWQLVDRVSLELGGKYDDGTGNNGDDRMIIAPFGEVKWEFDHDRVFSLWLRPEMTLETYSEYIKQIPYLVREPDIRPERKPVQFGGTFWYNSGILSLEINGSFAKSSNTAIVIADHGEIYLDYVDASKLFFRGDATFRLEHDLLLSLFGVIQPMVEDGTTTQLPMTPLVHIGARGETSFGSPVTVWSTLEYVSKQNVDRAATTTLGDHAILSSGCSTIVVNKVVVSATIDNLFNTAYQWWNSYLAPGRSIMINAKVNIQ